MTAQSAHATSRCVAFDLAQLFIGIEKRTPRGIDRVDLAYARHFLEQWNGDCVATLPTPWGVRWFDRQRALGVVGFVEDRWGESGEHDADAAYQWAKSKLRGERPTVFPRRVRSAPARILSGIADFARNQGLAWGKPIRSLPRGAIYLNTGQVTLSFPRLFGWLDDRKDIEPVVMLHDAMAIEHPELFTQKATRMHRQAMATTARWAARVIVSTEAAGASIRRELMALGRADIPMKAMPLPVPLPFLEPAAPDPDLRDIAFFVAAGSIEPHKNHLMLVNVWREMVRADGEKAPKLVLAGSRAKTNRAVIDMLERCEAIRDHVVQVTGLSTPAMRQLMAGAKAVLMPSFTEGFGLPIVEALALGTPVIASDLPSHREAGGSRATYIDPIDGMGWLAAIRAHAHREIASGEQIAKTPPVWTYSDYFERVEPFITGKS